ncbi:LysM peptidoglycan-binding domain-containing protein [candidate division WWE3 bacterium]|nr:LysM peptidoglycan-binding domain-containing protein [candidate division WWE3 bacterium]
MAQPIQKNEDKDNVEYVMRPTSSAITAILAGILVVAAGFLAYRYFNRGQKSEIGSGRSVVNQPNEVIEEKSNETPDKEIKVEEDDTAQKPAVPKLQQTPSVQTSTVWKANDYRSGDIKGSSYTVKSGDTLWEIAEGRYGSGAEWTKILNANSSSVRFLPNGVQALIVPGQALALP